MAYKPSLSTEPALCLLVILLCLVAVQLWDTPFFFFSQCFLVAFHIAYKKSTPQETISKLSLRFLAAVFPLLITLKILTQFVFYVTHCTCPIICTGHKAFGVPL